MLTNDEKKIIEKLYVDKKNTVKQIISILNNPEISESSIYHFIQRSGYTRKTIAPKLSQKEKDLIFEKHKEGLNCSEIGRILGYSNKRINAFIRKNGLSSSLKKRDKLTKIEINDIKTMYNDKCTGKEILKKYRNIISCENTILKIAKEEGCKIRPCGQIPWSLNEYFF